MGTIGFQGVKGAYSELAAFQFFGEDAKTKAFRQFEDVFAAVENGRLAYGIVPIENSLAGSIHQNYDLLQNHRVWIYGEHFLRVSHNLLAKKGTSLKKVKKIFSHPQALAQCALGVKGMPGVEAIASFDTAGAAEHVAYDKDPTSAAIASSLAAEHFGLKILKKRFEDNELNYTRFLIVGKPPLHKARVKKTHKPHKSSIVFALKNIPGGLHKCLSIFAIREIDLFKIESRPMVGSPWRYLFYLDFAGSVYDPACERSLVHLEEITEELQVLGTYPCGEQWLKKG